MEGDCQSKVLIVSGISIKNKLERTSYFIMTALQKTVAKVRLLNFWIIIEETCVPQIEYTVVGLLHCWILCNCDRTLLMYDKAWRPSESQLVSGFNIEYGSGGFSVQWEQSGGTPSATPLALLYATDPPEMSRKKVLLSRREVNNTTHQHEPPRLAMSPTWDQNSTSRLTFPVGSPYNLLGNIMNRSVKVFRIPPDDCIW